MRIWYMCPGNKCNVLTVSKNRGWKSAGVVCRNYVSISWSITFWDVLGEKPKLLTVYTYDTSDLELNLCVDIHKFPLQWQRCQGDDSFLRPPAYCEDDSYARSVSNSMYDRKDDLKLAIEPMRWYCCYFVFYLIGHAERRLFMLCLWQDWAHIFVQTHL